MRIPIFWLKDYVKLPKNLSVLADKLTMAGHLLDKVEKFDGEVVIDLELRGNRADCYSILGIAKEVSALFKTPVKYPPSYKKLKRVDQLSECKNNITTPYVKRVMMVAIKNVKICESPLWITKRLNAYGIPTINNIVDLTNFVMLETGEPMHAFDLDMIGDQIGIRLARNGEKMTTFLDQTLTLTSDDLVWANPTSLLSVAGAIGGKNRSILPETKNVLLEAANYDRANIRRSIYRHNLLTDAGIRHEKDLDPNLVEPAIYRYLRIIEENKWGKISPFVFDYYPKPVKPWSIELTSERIKSLGAIKISPGKIREILTWLNFKIIQENAKSFKVSVPTYRTDVTNEEDLIEEILRIYGYENIPAKILDLEIPLVLTPSYINQEIEIKDHVSSLGFDEAITFSFVEKRYSNLNKSLDETGAQPVEIVNFPSPDTKDLRMSLLPNLYGTAKRVIDERANGIRYFEVGKVFFKKGGYKEKRKLGLIYWKKVSKNSNLIFKGYLEALFKKIGLENIGYKETLEAPNLTESYEIISDRKTIGVAGKYEDLYFAEIDLDSILGKSAKPKAHLWPKYPPQIEDLTLVFPDKTYIGEVLQSIKRVDQLISNVELTGVYKGSYTFKVWYQHPTKTLTDREVAGIRNKILKEVKEKFGGILKNP